ncbi:MAG: hypothetical protein ACREEW_09375 [Caulobacteraceae bacterium]
MSRMPFLWASEPELERSRLRPWLLLALIVALVTFFATLALR